MGDEGGVSGGGGGEGGGGEGGGDGAAPVSEKLRKEHVLGVAELTAAPPVLWNSAMRSGAWLANVNVSSSRQPAVGSASESEGCQYAENSPPPPPPPSSPSPPPPLGSEAPRTIFATCTRRRR